MFAVDHNKPMAIVETAAMFNTKAEAVVDAYHMKMKWLEQVLMHTRFLNDASFGACWESMFDCMLLLIRCAVLNM